MSGKNLKCLLVLSLLSACSSDTAQASASAGSTADTPWNWEEPVVLICPGDESSGAAVTLQALEKPLEEELGVDVTIVCKNGASCEKSVEYLLSQSADGYTYALYDQSVLIDSAVSAEQKSQLEPVCLLAQDHYVLFIDASLEITTLEELKTYALAHPDELALALDSLTGQAAETASELFAAMGIEITMVDAVGDAYGMLEGGHAHLILGTLCEGNTYLEDGSLTALAVLSEERLSALPDVPTAAECGYAVTGGPWRMLVQVSDAPEKASAAMAQAQQDIEQNNTDWQTWKQAAGLGDSSGFLDQAEAASLWQELYSQSSQ